MRTTIFALCLLLFAASARAGIKTETVEYKCGEMTLKGLLAYQEGQTDKRPGILVVHEWWGCNQYAKDRAMHLAEMGYVAFACDMYGNGQTTVNADEAGKLAGAVRQDTKVWRERAAAGLKVLSDHKLVDAGKLAAIGYCFGGTTCLQMACDGQNLKAAVSFHGSLFTPTAAEAKAIKGTVLVCNGAADTFISADDRKGFVNALETAKTDYVFIDYAGAVHSFTNPDAGKAGIQGVAYDEKADKRSWADMKQVFDEVFGPVRRHARVGPLDPPGVLTDDQILAMDKQTAMKEWVGRKAYPHKNPDVDSSTRARLDGEVAKLRQQMNAASGSPR